MRSDALGIVLRRYSHSARGYNKYSDKHTRLLPLAKPSPRRALEDGAIFHAREMSARHACGFMRFTPSCSEIVFLSPRVRETHHRSGTSLPTPPLRST